MSNPIHSRTQLLLGERALKEIAQKRVIIFGVGGVGGWCAESLVRSGIKNLTIVDSDCVCASNINRQLVATVSNIGRAKVEVLRERLLDINPNARIEIRQERYSAGTAASFHLEDYDYVIDAIDSLQNKADLILHATSLPVGFFSSMGAALKFDPARIKVAEFWRVNGCPLGAALRRRFRRIQQFPARKFKCVYSDELLQNQYTDPLEPLSNGTIVHVTAVFGFYLASLVIGDIVQTLDTQQA